MLQVLVPFLGAILVATQDPQVPESPANDPARDGMEILRAAAEEQTNSKDLVVTSFYADLLLLDRRQTDQDVRLELKFDRRLARDGTEIPRIQTRLDTAKGPLSMAFDGRDYWRNTTGRTWERISVHVESDAGDRQELERRVRLCHTLTQVFSLRVMLDRLENVRLVQRDVPDLDAAGRAMTWAHELRALSRDLGQLVPDPAAARAQPGVLPPLPGEPTLPGEDAGSRAAEPPVHRAELRLFFDEKHRLGRLDVRPHSEDGTLRWETIYLDLPRVVSPLGEGAGKRVRIPTMALIYETPRAPGVREIFRINLKHVQLNRRFDEAEFTPVARDGRRP